MTTARRRRSASVVVWVVLAAALAAALAVSASRSAAPLAPAARAEAIDAGLKCPSCQTISVADSSAATAAAVRQIVLTRVREGQSDQQIDQYLVGVYGPSILLRPSASGLTAVVWVVPVVAAAGGLGGLGVLFWRRRRPVAVPVSAEDRALVERALAGKGLSGSPRAPGP